MSTRIRVLLMYKGGYFQHGAQAIKEMCRRSFVDFKELKGTKQERLLSVANELHPDFTLVLIREAKSTPKNRSLYWKFKQKGRD